MAMLGGLWFVVTKIRHPLPMLGDLSVWVATVRHPMPMPGGPWVGSWSALTKNNPQTTINYHKPPHTTTNHHKHNCCGGCRSLSSMLSSSSSSFSWVALGKLRSCNSKLILGKPSSFEDLKVGIREAGEAEQEEEEEEEEEAEEEGER